MTPKVDMPTNTQKIPTPLVWGMVVICVMPFLLNLMGVDFASQKTPFPWEKATEMAPHERVEGIFQMLSGSFTHTLLEWSAFMIAMFTMFLAFLHFSIKRDVTVPILGVALFCAGVMDAFHTLAADRLIEAVADNRNLIPFTWAISRMFNALILIIGVSIFLMKGQQDLKGDIKLLLFTTAGFGIVAYAIISYCANSAQLPQTMYPDSLITRPYDVIPLGLYLLGALTVFSWFYKRRPGLFTHALLLGMVPEIVVEIHMAFGSTALFDNHFNIAHFIKIFAYLVPFLGLGLDYVETSRQLEREVKMRKLMEIALRENEESVATTLHSIGDAVIATDTQGKVTRMNPIAELLTGWTLSEAQGHSLGKVFHIVNENTRNPVVSPVKKVLDEGVTVGLTHHTVLISKDGQDRPIADSAAPIRNSQGEVTGCVLVFRDVTKEKRGQAAMARMASIVETSEDAIVSMDLEEKIITWNAAAERIFGYSAEEMVGQSIKALLPAGLEEKDLVAQAQNQSNQLEGIRIRKDGQQIHISLSLSPIREEGGEAIGMSMIVRDITQQKRLQAEREVLNRQLVDTSRRVGMADVATSVLHNVGNVLNSINVSAGMVINTVRRSSLENVGRTAFMIQEHAQDLGTYLTQDPKGRQIPEYLTKLSDHLGQEQAGMITELEGLMKNIEHIKEIVSVQQNVAKSAGFLEPVQLADLMEQSLSVNSLSLQRHDVEMIRAYEDLPDISVDKHQVLQILVNLISNAKHAMKSVEKPSHTLTLRIGRDSENPERIHMTVEDTGVGIPPENLNRIFSQGFTTKKDGHGFGLHSGALSAKLMGGDLILHSKGEGQGAIFTLRLPANAVAVEIHS